MSNEHVCKLIEIKKEHSDVLSIIHGECFPHDAWSKETFEGFCDEVWGNITGWIAAHKNKEVGFILARQVVDTAEILSFAVLPHFQGKGIGRQLLKELINAVEVPLFLEVSVDNKPAVHLYQSLGFEIMTTRKNYYDKPTRKSGRDAYLMRLRGNT